MNLSKMTIKTPDPNVFRMDAGLESEWTPSMDVLQQWNPRLQIEDEGDNTISIFDPIGINFFGDGVTAKRIEAALRQIGRTRDVVVNINSPGGLMFEGIAIYNILKAHRGAVRVNVIGIAASAASVIAMAGDEIVMNTGSQMMIHNPMAVAIGDFRDMQDMSGRLEKSRSSVIDIYQDRTDQAFNRVAELMDEETFFKPDEAVELGFATDVEEMQITERDDADDERPTNKKKLVETVKVALAREGLTRKEREQIFQELGITASVTDDSLPAASVTGNPDTSAMVAAVQQCLNTFKG